jgi:cysteine desulfurase/selenocysteine lyase
MLTMKIDDEFTILRVQENGKRLIYLDNAATTQHPRSVLDRVVRYYTQDNANPHRGVYDLAQRATDAHENARKRVARFINAKRSEEVVFTQNCSEALNLVAVGYGMEHIGEGDEIVVAVSEHHSSMVPWQRVAKAKGAVIRYLYPDKNGRYTEKEIREKITPETRVVAIAHISNVLGIVNPVRLIAEYAHKVGAIVVLDCAQSISHIRVDVQELDVDLAAFSGHKMYAPMGVGVLYGRSDLLRSMEPMLCGGDMISEVHEGSYSWADVPRRFETGTRNVGGEVGLEAAIDFVERIGRDRIAEHEDRLMKIALEEMRKLDHIDIYGGDEGRKGVISFNVRDVHPHDVASLMDSEGIALRAGHHCAQPLMEYLGIGSCCRISLAVYNTEDDIRTFLDVLSEVRRWMGLGS